MFAGIVLSPAAAAKSAQPVITEIRLGEHGDATRVVVDLSGHAAPFSWHVNEDGTGLTVLVQAAAHTPILPKRRVGLVRTVSTQTVAKGTLVTIATGLAISVATTGTLAPNATYRHHRIFLDLAGAAAVSPPMPSAAAIPPGAPAPLALLPREAPEGSAAAAKPPTAAPSVEPQALPTRGQTLVYTASDRTTDAKDSEPAEPSFTIKLGGVAERSFADKAFLAGPSVAVQAGILNDSVEIEAGTAPLFDHGHIDWNSGILVKKPFEISRQFDVELGAGPTWIHKSTGDGPSNGIGAEAIAELVYWPSLHKNLGWYLESGYGYDFGRLHDSDLGLRLGVLFAVP
jgi:hypothetical protein